MPDYESRRCTVARIVIFAAVLTVIWAQNSPEADGNDAPDVSNSLTFLTISDKAQKIYVNLVSHVTDKGLNYPVLLSSGKKPVTKDLSYNYTISDGVMPLNTDNVALGSVAAPAPATGQNFTYNINGVNGDDDGSMRPLDDADSPTNLRVCVFGDFRADLYADIALNLSSYIDSNNCNLVLFIGKIVWEHRSDGFAFNPYVMLHSGNDDAKHVSFASVPSIFGEVGSGYSETTFFDCTEVNGVAFIQTTVTLVTTANVTYGTEQFEKVEEYFRETMLNELECKLQELYKREKKPWIIIYLTHPSLFKEQTVGWLLLNSIDRFFEILKRYKIDLLTSCGIEGMTKILEERAQSHPDEQLPAYIQTTLAECGGYMAYAPSVQNECSYTVLDIQKSLIFYEKKGMASESILNGTIVKNTEQPDKCVEHEL